MPLSYVQNDTDDCVLVQPRGVQATAAVIWLHGLGADGQDFVPIVPELRLDESLPIRFIFPHARARPVTINGGYVMRAWYDIRGIASGAPEDEAGIRESEQVVRGLVRREVGAGIAVDRIAIAGFSQGGAIALQTALRYPQALAGVMALSTYLPLRNTLEAEASAANKQIPILMCHGTQDQVVQLGLGEQSRDLLVKLGYAVEWKTYPMPHSVCPEQIGDIAKWLKERLA
jgi:phospholipase/carboxylesterase